MTAPFDQPYLMLSASIPGQHFDHERAQEALPTRINVEQAVVSLARAVFAAGGRIVMGGHPTITPLLVQVAAEHARQPVLEPDGPPDAPLVIYQSEAFAPVLPAATRALAAYGHAHLTFVPAQNGEAAGSTDPQAASARCPQSIAAMRRVMILECRPVALVCIGGRGGVREEARLFAQAFPGRPIYALASTGGDAADLVAEEQARDIEGALLAELAEQRWRLRHAIDQANPDELLQEDEPVPYPLVARAIVATSYDLPHA